VVAQQQCLAAGLHFGGGQTDEATAPTITPAAFALRPKTPNANTLFTKNGFEWFSAAPWPLL
jgi:hypothetical protein